jgi:hypothetical protein
MQFRSYREVGWAALIAVAGDSEVSTRHARHEHRRQTAGEACLPFHGNPLPLNAMRFYSAMWQEFENFLVFK